MNDTPTRPHESLLMLIVSSLALWRCSGSAHLAEAGTIVVEASGHTAHIARTASGVPFRWSINIDGRERVASSVTGLLRMLRIALDPEFRPSRVRIAPIEIAPP